MIETAKKARRAKPTTKVTPVQAKILQQKQNLIDALWNNRGIITAACADAGLHRATYYEYFNNDPDFRAKAAEAQEIALDHVEGKLHELIDGPWVTTPEGSYRKEPNASATIFYLKTKGKRRGYIEQQNIEHSGSVNSINAKEAAFEFLKLCKENGIESTDEALEILKATHIDEIPDEVKETVVRDVKALLT